MEVAKTTDSIPRVTVDQMLLVLDAVSRSANGKATFDTVRQALHARSTRRAPASREAMWTAARDALSDLQRLGYAAVGVLPRKRSEVERLRETPCELTESGRALVKVSEEKRGRAFDELLVAWMNGHPYFRAFVVRLLDGPLFVPDVTSAKQFSVERTGTSASTADKVVANCVARLNVIGFPANKVEVFEREVRARVEQQEAKTVLADLDAKKWVDVIQDLVVIPAFLAAESLPFDSVTFQHLIKVSQDFLAAAWTSSHPTFEGRVVFQTCEFRPDPRDEAQTTEVVHHGKSFATASGFSTALQTNYQKIGGPQPGYVSAYALRALVCCEMAIQPVVFARCLEDLIRAGATAGMTIYTELPFTPPPAGEGYVEVNKRRVGLIKLVGANGG